MRPPAENACPDRREFLKQVASTAAVGSLPDTETSGVAAEALAERAGESQTRPAIEFPRVFRGRQLAMVAFPLGGVGTGSISLGGRGQLRDWEIVNRPAKGNSPSYAFPAIWAQVPGEPPVVRVLESRIQPPYGGGSGLGSANVPGLPRLEDAVFTGEFPFASIDFRDSLLPAKVRLEAFSPFVPLDAEASGLPVAILRYRIENPSAREARVAMAFSLTNPVGAAERTNEYREEGLVCGLWMHSPSLDPLDPFKGSFALAVIRGSAEVTYSRHWRGATGWPVGALAFWDDFSHDGALESSPLPGPSPTGSLCAAQRVPPGEEKTFTFLLAWHFPNRTPERSGWSAPEGQEREVIGNYYTTRFKDAWEVVRQVAPHLPELEKATRDFLEAMEQTTLPPTVVDAALSNLSTLHTNTCFRTADGAFHAFEGCNDQAGCCFGSCTHVWNYESALAFLFPYYSRSLRESQFGYSTDEQGRMDFRYYLPFGQQHFGSAAADGQMGALMKLYVDWRLSGDTAWLQRLWPSAKKALEFAWIEGGWDADRDGVMEGCQHNTYDIEFYGPNPLCGVWYLGALRACEEMAKVVGDPNAAAQYRTLFNRGSAWIDENLFNGEYYIQKIHGRPASQIAQGLTLGMGAADPENPEFQMGDGCLADQLVGQCFAHVAGLGALLDQPKVRQTLESIYRHNFKADLSLHESVQRVYALNDEAGLVVCDYAGRTRPAVPFPYYAEVWTGHEYQAAALMFFEDMFEPGLELVEAARRRHDGERRNPWDESECGHHYARALSSWSCVLALCGFNYLAAEATVSLLPRMTSNPQRGFWCIPTGWGTFSVDRAGDQVVTEFRALRGELVCGKIELQPAGLGKPSSVAATLGEDLVEASAVSDEDHVNVILGRRVRVIPGTNLRLSISV